MKQLEMQGARVVRIAAATWFCCSLGQARAQDASMAPARQRIEVSLPDTIYAVTGDSLTMHGFWSQEARRRLCGTGGRSVGLGLTNITFVGRVQGGGVRLIAGLLLAVGCLAVPATKLPSAP